MQSKIVSTKIQTLLESKLQGAMCVGDSKKHEELGVKSSHCVKDFTVQ